MSDETDDAEPVHNREWIAELLERAEFVEWDRFVVGSYHTGEQYVDVYGWIDRDDDYKDFVWTRFRPDNEPDPTMEFTTSSDEYSEELMRIWFGKESLDDHNECRRVEHAFDVENAIELGEQATLVTDGGVDRDDAGVLHVSGSVGYYRTAGDSPHNCPVCGRTYIPNAQSVRVDGTGPLLMQLDDLCLKGGDDWFRAYYHDKEVIVDD